MEWFARHTSWLYRETKQLSSNSSYREQYQEIEETLISSGNIIIHKSKTEYFPILIVYPEATPYIPPTIYILENEISKETAIEYSVLSPEDIRQRVRSNIRFFNRRHQNEDGSVCFVETGDLHGETPEIYPIEDIIKRLRIWLSGRIPKDSAEVELFHHFANRTYEIEYLLPDLFFDSEIVQGKFYAGLSSLIPANFFPDEICKKTYMGVMLYGENQAGVTLPPKIYVNKQLVLFTSIPDVNQLILEENSQEKVKRISDGDLIEGYWWEISTEPEPFSNVTELARYIGDGDEETGTSELVNKLEPELKRLDDFIYVGLRFPGRFRDLDWQMFRLTKGGRSPIIASGEEELKQRLFDYSIQAVYQEYFTDDYFHMRNMGRAERGLLKDKAISVIGCGALGSETADALNKAGVGSILLVDKENLRAHNVVRHSLGINRTNFPKAIGMEEHLVLHNPFVKIDHKILNILFAEIKDYFPGNSIGVSSIADDSIEAYLNQQAVDHGRTVFYCRVLRGGKVARIFRVIPQTDACKACLGQYLNDGDPVFLNIQEDESLPVITNECNNPVRPASAADMKIISGIFARIIIDFLQGKDTANNHWIWSSESLEGITLEASTYGMISTGNIPPHPNCRICQRMEDTKVDIRKNVLDFVKKEASESGDIETGGVLIGHRKVNGEYTILRASKPGPNAVRTKTRFDKDEEYCQKELLTAFKEFGEQGLYLGEWHYHPSGGNEPSGLDIKSLTEIAAQNEYRIDKPIMIILSPTLEYAITIHDKIGRCTQLPLNIVSEA
ncbi:thiamine/molybdopterin biosynthesis ThiF/MoeB-like protein [bacterium BMS3Bbin14]|nr:thiamine/molybdopterin biosynthesis ThiF/MoeB-like protein [bacterium BMS3Bbin14]